MHQVKMTIFRILIRIQMAAMSCAKVERLFLAGVTIRWSGGVWQLKHASNLQTSFAFRCTKREVYLFHSGETRHSMNIVWLKLRGEKDPYITKRHTQPSLKTNAS